MPETENWLEAQEFQTTLDAEGKIIDFVNPSIHRDNTPQLTSYLSATSAQGGFWTNGNKITFYRKDISSGSLIPWLGLPKYRQAWDSIGKYKKSDLIIPVDLKLAFRRCHNAIYSAGIDSEDIALDMVRIILSKIEDESSPNLECDFPYHP